MRRVLLCAPLWAAIAVAGCDDEAPRRPALADDAGSGRDRGLDPGPMDQALPTLDAEADAEADAAVDADADAEADAAVDAGPGVETDPCGRALHPDPDRPRVAVVGFPFGAEPGVDGTTLGFFAIGDDGHLTPVGERLDVATRPLRLRFLPSGDYLVVLGEDGIIHTVAMAGDDAPAIVDSIALPGAGWADLVVDPDGEHLHVTRRDVGDDSGVYSVAIGCGATLEPLADHLSLRLADTLALMPGDPDRAVLIGGQTAFAPFDMRDTRLIERRDDGGWRERAAFDLWGDFIDTFGIAIAPDGRTALVPNGSPISDEGGQVMVLGIEGDALRERQRIAGMDDARAAWFHHKGTALVTRLEPGRVSVLVEEPAGYAVVDELRYGLPEDLAMVQRGALDGLVVLPAVSAATGSQMVTLWVDGAGVVEEIAVLPLAEGGLNIPGAVAVAP
ncbi:MAG: hypothetical protein H6703_04140 [Myxococcales bacterium]|nr:hypothetical protein [Myxococcales bacterium]